MRKRSIHKRSTYKRSTHKRNNHTKRQYGIHGGNLPNGELNNVNNPAQVVPNNQIREPLGPNGLPLAPPVFIRRPAMRRLQFGELDAHPPAAPQPTISPTVQGGKTRKRRHGGQPVRRIITLPSFKSIPKNNDLHINTTLPNRKGYSRAPSPVQLNQLPVPNKLPNRVGYSKLQPPLQMKNLPILENGTRKRRYGGRQ